MLRSSDSRAARAAQGTGYGNSRSRSTARRFPELRYIIVGEGVDEARLRALAKELGVSDRIGFVGPMRDDELPEAYATSTIYLGASRVDNEINVEGFGISFLEAAASGVPAVGETLAECAPRFATVRRESSFHPRTPTRSLMRSVHC